MNPKQVTEPRDHARPPPHVLISCQQNFNINTTMSLAPILLIPREIRDLIYVHLFQSPTQTILILQFPYSFHSTEYSRQRFSVTCPCKPNLPATRQFLSEYNSRSLASPKIKLLSLFPYLQTEVCTLSKILYSRKLRLLAPTARFASDLQIVRRRMSACSSDD